MGMGDFQTAHNGGEEFALILPETHSKGACHVAEIIRSHVSGLKIAHTHSDVSEFVTLSAGVSCATDAGTMTPKDLIRQADQALYLAKESGRNQLKLFRPPK